MVSPQMTNMSLRRIVRDSAILIGLLLTVYLVFVAAPAKGVLFSDAYAYWKVDLAYPYAGQVGDLGFFPYSPPIALLFAPLGNLSWLAFLAVWYGLIFASLAWLARGSFLLFLSLLAFPPVALNLVDGNIHIFLAVVIALGFRYPALWSAVLLTKVTPGVALLWFAVRREWRSLAVALGVTAAIAGVTFVFMPTQWIDWVSMLHRQFEHPATVAGIANSIVAAPAHRGGRCGVGCPNRSAVDSAPERCHRPSRSVAGWSRDARSLVEAPERRCRLPCRECRPPQRLVTSRP